MSLSPRTRDFIVVWGAVLALLALSLATRLPDVGALLNIDAAWGWHPRTAGFWHAIRAGEWGETYQKLHPGVTLMWLSGLALELGPGVSATITPERVAFAALPVALIGSALAPLTFVLWRKLVGARHLGPAFIAALLMATEPFLAGHSRTAHLDLLVTVFCWLAALSTGLALRRGLARHAVGAGVLLGLAVLTKVAAGALAVGIAAWYGVVLIRGRRPRLATLGLLALTTGVAIGTAFALWPALWDAPIETLRRLVKEASQVVGRGHSMFFWGEVHKPDPGGLFYGAVVLWRATPEVVLTAGPGLALMLWGGAARRRSRRGRRVTALRLVTLGALVVYGCLVLQLVLSPKKIDRYLLPTWPLLCMASGYAMWWLVGASRRLITRWRPVGWAPVAIAAGVVLVSARGERLVAVHPYPTAWGGQWFGVAADEMILLGWGEGTREAAEFIKANARSPRPLVWAEYYHPAFKAWLPQARYIKDPRSMKRADYIVWTMSSWQRERFKGGVTRYGGERVFTVDIGGTTFVEVYTGPGAKARRRRPRSGRSARGP